MQTAALTAIVVALREQLLRQTDPVILSVAAAALGALAKAPELSLTVAAEVTKVTAELLKQLNRRLSELEVRASPR